MGVNSLPKTVTRQRRDCDLNPGPSAPESSTLTTRYRATQLHYSELNYNRKARISPSNLSVFRARLDGTL